MTTKHVSLEEVNKIVERYSWSVVLDLGFRHDIKSLPTIDINSLQRYDCYDEKMWKEQNGEYVRYSDIVDLFQK